MSTCPLCREGTVKSVTVNKTFDYKDHEITVSHYIVHRCDSCGEEIVVHGENKTADEALVRFQRDIDDLLRPEDIAKIRKSLGYTQAKFAQILKVGAKNFARYESGISAQSRAMDWLLRILRDSPENITLIDKEATPSKESEVQLGQVSGTKHCSIPDMNVNFSANKPARLTTSWTNSLSAPNWRYNYRENDFSLTGTDS